MSRLLAGMRSTRYRSLFFVLLAVVLTVSAKAVIDEKDVGLLSPHQIEEGVQVRNVVLSLERAKLPMNVRN